MDDAQRDMSLNWEMSRSNGRVFIDAWRSDGWKTRLDLGPEEDASSRLKAFIGEEA